MQKTWIENPQTHNDTEHHRRLLPKIEDDWRELRFLGAPRLLEYTGLAIDEFAAMLSDEEPCRTELSS